MDLTAKTFAGLEEELQKELVSLGADDVKIIKRGCTFRGDEAILYKVNYLSRLAIRILKPIGVFDVKNEEQLYDKVKKINWLDVFKQTQTFSVEANLFHSDFDHSHYAALKTKDAIVDQFRDETGKRPWVSVENPNIYIDVHVSHNVCTISLDSSGESLHKRGYKIGADKAPINEILAAGMIALSGWKCDCDFYDPMCGSGTIPIEAAMLAMNIPAGYYRKEFAFMNWDGYDEILWEKIKQEANDNLKEHEHQIFASDRSEKAIGITKRNLKHAGLHKDISVKVAYFDSLEPENKGFLIMNPPYGIRMEERGELRDLYRGIGNVLKSKFVGFVSWIISPNFDSAKFIGLRPSQKITLYNGPVETKYMKFEVYEGTRRYGDTEKPDWKDNRKSDSSDKKEEDHDKKSSFPVKTDDSRRKSFSGDDSKRRSFSDDDRKRKSYSDDDGKRKSYSDNARGFKRRSSSDFDKPERKFDDKRRKFDNDDSSNEDRRNVNKERSEDFERRMESLRRFTGSEWNTPEKKRTRKRITKKPPEKDNSDQ